MSIMLAAMIFLIFTPIVLLVLVLHWLQYGRIRRHLRRKGWPRRCMRRLDMMSYNLKHWRRVPPYEEVQMIPWSHGRYPPGLMSDCPFTWKDPEAPLWATLRLLEVQRNWRYTKIVEEKYWEY